MIERPTYKELEQRIKELEKEVAKGKRAKKELSQERDIFLQGPVVVFKWAAKGNWPAEYVSPNVAQFGYQADDFISNKLLYIDIIHPEDLERVVSEVQAHIESGIVSYEQEYRIIQADGKVKWVGDHTVVHRDDKNEIINYDSYILDNADRKLAEEALQESEDLLKATLESTADGILVVDEKSQVIHANNRFAKMWRIPNGLIKSRDDEKLLSYVLDQLVEPKVFLSKVQELYETSKEDFDTLFFKNGRIFERYSRPLIRAGKIAGRVWSFRDVTERSKVQEELRESEEKYREIVERTDDLITRVDREGRFIYVNHVAEKIFGISMDQCVGMSAFDFIHPDDRERTIVEFNGWVRNGLLSVTFENRQVNKITGEVYLMFWTINLHYDKKGNLTGINGIARDLTLYKKLEDELFKAKKLESIGILSGGIAHDFNNLLSIIMGNISMTRDDVKPEYGVTDFLNEAEEASLKAKELANQLITFSKGGAPVKKIGTIEDLVKETTNFTLSGSNIKSEFFFPDDLWFIEFDDGQMQHAVKNIIDNAVESMSDGGTIDVKVENLSISLETTEQSLPLPVGNYVKISIQDHGVGIPEEHLSKIFDPYFSTKEMGIQKGMGMGLATTYSIIDRHDGHITVESEVGVGTTFTLYLPAHEKDVRELELKEISKPEEPSIRTGRIFLMDDEKMIRNLAKQILSRLGYEPEVAKDGIEAIELYKRAKDSDKPYDAVILDLTIKGGMGGKDTVKALMEIDPQVKAIVSSGYSNDPVMTNFRAYGFIGALPKPYAMKDLKDMLNQALGKS